MHTHIKDPDVVLIGGGIMSATLGIFLKKLDPDLTIQILESLPHVAQESSSATNNAGTGHAALCELNYTPIDIDGAINVSKAIKINEQFETSKHFWGYLVEQEIIKDPRSFITCVPHLSFVYKESDQVFLHERYEAMNAIHFFGSMKYTEDYKKIRGWAPLLMKGRKSNEPLAVTCVESGTDVNYGVLTRTLIYSLISCDGVGLAVDSTVTNIERNANGRWDLMVKAKNGEKEKISSKFVFIGAGGGALPLLQKSGIPEGKGYGGFPVSGNFLVCQNETIVNQHTAKVYGRAAEGSPPMSVPHLDTRMIDGKRSLLFGPFAGFSPKFLKNGSNWDLLKSIRWHNMIPMIAAGCENRSLTKYLINECRKTHADRCDLLREFFPDAKDEDWKLMAAGQRVQIIKKGAGSIGKLQFGTEVVTSRDGSLATVLGASPGASTTASIMLDLLKTCFPTKMESDAWRETLEEMVPGYGKDLVKDQKTYRELHDKANALLKLYVFDVVFVDDEDPEGEEDTYTVFVNHDKDIRYGSASSHD